MKRIVLCADDYGQNSAISQAILDLLQKNRLSAVSCMTTSPTWDEQAKLLVPFKNQADIGLHFNLTEGTKLAQPLPRLILMAFLRRLDSQAIEAEFNRQIDRFVSTIGRAPDFIDGHQHILQLPQIREIILTVYEQRLRKDDAYIRDTHTPGVFKQYRDKAFIKKVIIELCGAERFHQELIDYSIPHNSSFAGIYSFSPDQQYAQLFPSFLQQIQDRGLIMCHPGYEKQPAGTDTIAKSRVNEYSYIASDEFLRDCEREQVKIGRFRNTV